MNGRWRVRLVHREDEYAMNVELSGPERGAWTLKATGGHGTLLDIVHKGMTMARAFLEGEHEARRQLAAELSPHAEALCRRYLARGVKQDGQWRVRTVQDGEKHAMYVRLSGPAQGTWEDETAARRGDLLDIIRHTATDGDVTKAMEAARAFLEAQLRQRHKTAQSLEQERPEHKISPDHGIGL